MTLTQIPEHEQGDVSRTIINNNSTAIDAALGTKLEFSGTAPAVGDMAVFDATDGLGVKKKVFTASQTLESDSNGQPVSAAKGTAYNLNLGTTAGTVLDGSNDALYMKLAGTQTVTGDKTFTGALTIPSATVATTQSVGDNSNKVATTAFVTAALSTYSSGTTTKNSADASTTQNIAHGLGKTPRFVRIEAIPTVSTNQNNAFAKTVYNGTTQSSVSVYGTSTASVTVTTFTLNSTAVSGDGTTTGVVTVDSTNIIITWTKTGTPTGSYTLLWEALS